MEKSEGNAKKIDLSEKIRDPPSKKVIHKVIKVVKKKNVEEDNNNLKKVNNKENINTSQKLTVKTEYKKLDEIRNFQTTNLNIEEKASKFENMIDIAKLPPKIIDQININPSPSRLPNIKLIYIYHRSQFHLQIKPTTTLLQIKKLISQTILVPIENFDMFYNDNPISSLELKTQISKFINFSKLKCRPIFEIKKKARAITELENLSEIYHRNYNNKVHISHLPSIDVSVNVTLLTIINQFFKDLFVSKDFIIENDPKGGYYVCFPSSDLAFDFNRYMSLIKNTQKIFKNCKTYLKLENGSKTPRLSKNKNYDSKNKHSNPLSAEFVCMSGEYMSEEERRRKEAMANKKKWVCEKDFITSVGKYSGIQI